MKVSGAIASIGLSAAEAYRQTVKASNELVRFSSLANLPGGARTPFQGSSVFIRSKKQI